MMVLAVLASQNTLVIDIFRRYSATHDNSTVPDFIVILHLLRIKYTYNKTTKVFSIGTSTVRFVGADDVAKLHGAQRDIAFINEATELTLAQFNQINQRTSQRIILDFNPWAKSHWVYTIPDLYPNDHLFFRTTYKDNPALSPEQVKAIEAYQINDPAMWRVYGLGERITPEELIYPNATTCTVMPDGETVYGVDFGSSSPTAVVRVTRVADAIYVQELVYERNMATADLIERCKELVGKRATIYCDAAEPDRIREMVSAGLQARAAIKDVEAGIGYVKGLRLLTLYDASDDPVVGKNLLMEVDSYSWQRNRQTGVIMDVPVKANDHLLDAMRYAVYTHWGRKTKAIPGYAIPYEPFNAGATN
jgi:phage terminase large subunit